MRPDTRLRTLGPVARVDMVSRVTLLSGLILFVFTAGHLANHALGILSLGAMEAGRGVSEAVWRSLPGTALLFGSLGAHATFGLWRFYERRSMHLPRWETVQILSGLAIPFFLTAHVLETRMFAGAFGVEAGYPYMLVRAWPDRIVPLVVVLLLSWVHGCMGVHYWLRLRWWYAALRPMAQAVAILVPALALIGLARGMAEALALAADPDRLRAAATAGHWPNSFAEAVANKAELYALVAYAGAVLLVVAARALRAAVDFGRTRVRIDMGHGRITRPRVGATVLDACREAGFPLAAPCGGRGRCAGCQVRVGRGREGLKPPDDDERSLLAEVGASPEVRLACRIRPLIDIHAAPLLPPWVAPTGANAPRPYLQGRQQQVAILAAAAPVPPQIPGADAVAAVNWRLRRFGDAARAMGGVPDPAFQGGLTALFGLSSGAQSGTAAAVAAAFRILRSADAAGETPPALALHAGPAIVSEFGRADPTALSAVGVTVRVSRRLVEAARDYGSAIVISEDAREAAGFDLTGFPRRLVPIAGWDEPLLVHTIADYRELAAAIVARAGPPPAEPPHGWLRRMGLAG